jgi:hypothetical protein
MHIKNTQYADEIPSEIQKSVLRAAAADVVSDRMNHNSSERRVSARPKAWSKNNTYCDAEVKNSTRPKPGLLAVP